MKATSNLILLAALVWVNAPLQESLARGPRTFLEGSSPLHSAASGKPWLPQTLLPASTYSIDDGRTELGLGFGNGSQNFEAIWFNQFYVIPGQTTITGLEIAWGDPNAPTPAGGTPVTLGIWSDPNNDGNPSDAVLLASTTGTISNANSNTFVTYPFFPAVTMPEGATSFFVGDMTPTLDPPELMFQSLDLNSSLHRQSWVAAKSDGSAVDLFNLGNNDFLGVVDDFGFSGNWLIRADTAATGLVLQSGASSRDGFLVNLPLLGPSGVEDRAPQRDGRALVIIRFNHPIVSVGSATSSCGEVVKTDVNPHNPYELIVTLRRMTIACNASDIVITANDVTDDAGDVLASASVTLGYLIGDVNGDRVVDRADVMEVISQEGFALTGSNFRDDVNLDRVIDETDRGIVVRQRNTVLP